MSNPRIPDSAFVECDTCGDRMMKRDAAKHQRENTSHIRFSVLHHAAIKSNR